MASNRIFVIGGTGNVGKKAVQELLDNKVRVTLYARNPNKVTNLFPSYNIGDDDSLLSIIQGDLNDLTPLKEALSGHTRLFLLVNDLDNLPSLKETIAKLAYESDIRQIVDISSLSVSYPWRTSHIGYQHYLAEKKILDLAEQRVDVSFVALRPGRFMSNIISFDRPQENNTIVDTCPPDNKQGWISTNDIGAVAAVILQDDIQKHGNAVYEMIGDLVTPNQRADIFTRILDRPITYQHISVLEKFNFLNKFPHINFKLSFDLSSTTEPSDSNYITPGISILLGREPETVEQYIKDNKQAFL